MEENNIENSTIIGKVSGKISNSVIIRPEEGGVAIGKGAGANRYGVSIGENAGGKNKESLFKKYFIELIITVIAGLIIFLITK